MPTAPQPAMRAKGDLEISADQAIEACGGDARAAVKALRVAVVNEGNPTYLESLIREDFERCHPGETLEDLKRRASFRKRTEACCGTGWR
jgi:hypothetical protein